MKATITERTAYTVLNPARGFISRYDATFNPYSGCGFACEYCYARFFQGPEKARTWGEWVEVKTNAAQVLTRELRPGMSIYMSTVTDPYQPVEATAMVTRACLEAMLPFQPRLTIQTRSPMVTRDIDLLKQFTALRVNMTLNTDNEKTRLAYEPHAPGLKPRARALLQLKEAGIGIGVSISPMLPLVDPERMGRWLASLQAGEYMTLYMKLPKPGQMAAQTPVLALEHLREDGWDRAAYNKARAIIQDCISPARLKEETEGFSPPGEE